MKNIKKHKSIKLVNCEHKNVVAYNQNLMICINPKFRKIIEWE